MQSWGIWNTPSHASGAGALGQAIRGALATFFILGLMMFVFAVLGVQLFGQLDTSDSPIRFSFRTPYMALLTVCLLFAGEDWTDVAVYTMLQSSNAVYLYFVAAFVMGQWILVSLFISTFVEAFTSTRKAQRALDRRVSSLRRISMLKSRVWLLLLLVLVLVMLLSLPLPLSSPLLFLLLLPVLLLALSLLLLLFMLLLILRVLLLQFLLT